jgi:hypothetical protein
LVVVLFAPAKFNHLIVNRKQTPFARSRSPGGAKRATNFVPALMP